jgi:hypothetical protein
MFARVEDSGAGAGDGIDVLARAGGGSGQGLQKVECRSFTGQ